MAFTDIFIKRPVLSLVVSLLILLIGLRVLSAVAALPAIVGLRGNAYADPASLAPAYRTRSTRCS